MNGISWKFVAVTAILAMAVSLLSGGLSGVSFGTLIFRALAGGIVFAGIAAGVNVLIAQLYPELLEVYTSGSAMENESQGGRDDEAAGSRIDIVMPAEDGGIPGGLAPEESMQDASEPGLEVSPGLNADPSSVPVEPVEGSAGEPSGDLDRFSGDFSEVEDEGASPARASAGEGILGDHDVEEIAQAIHTVIKRDEKG